MSARRARARYLGALAALLVLGISLIVGGYRFGDAARDSSAENEAAVVVADTQSRLLELVDVAVEAAEAGAGVPVPARDGLPVLGAGNRVGIVGELTEPDVLLVEAAIARDTGTVRATGPLAAGDRTVVLVIAPTYRDGSPRSTAARRTEVVGFVVLEVDLSRLPASKSGAVRVTDGPAVVAALGAPGGAAHATGRVEVRGREWQVDAWAPTTFPGGAVVAIVGCLAVIALVAARIEVARRRRLAGAMALEIAHREGKLLTELAAVLQASLDLSDVCPAFATLLFEQLPVDGVSLEVVRESGATWTVFAIGAATDTSEPPTDRVRTAPTGGSTIALAMQRDRRLHGVLRLRITKELSESDRRVAVVASQLVGAAMDNALAHARQHDALRRLSELDELKTVFLGTAAHELRTPVTAIVGFSEMLRDRSDQLSDDQRTLLIGRVADNASGLRLLVEDLLDFSRLDGGRMAGSPEALALDVIVTGTVAKLGPVLSNHTVELSLEPGTTVLADRAAVERIVTNLVANAAKFSPDGSTIRVHVANDDAGARCRLVVDDEGPGVPPADRVRIFSRFYRGKGEEVVRTRGTGIGLAVVLELVRLLWGAVEVGDAPGGGARFTVTLPSAPQTGGPPMTANEEALHAANS